MRGLTPESGIGKTAFLRRLFTEKPLGALGAVIILVLVLVALFADYLAPYGFSEQNLSEALEGYSRKHFLGTDQLGRDVFSRVLYGARISLTVGFACVAISITGAVLLGLISGYFGGKIDAALQRLVDAFMAIPDLVFVLTFMAVFGPGMLNVILALSLISLIWNSRVVRGEVLSLKQNPYVEAARAMGASTFRIMFLQILPNAVAPVIILGTTRIGGYILGEASLSFLGFGIPPPFPTWGGMLSGTGITYMYRAPWLAIWPGFALGITVFAFNMLGDAMRDLLDPRLRGSK
ncbi:MAG: ABC transporter permease [Nitrospinota bacterium]|nr:MAG: ABC transporter permease [Nitrospinota bacterium]